MGKYTDGRFENNPFTEVKLEDTQAWQDKSGKLVEEFITRTFDTLDEKDVASMKYINRRLYLYGKPNTAGIKPIICDTEISVVEPVYSYGIKIYGLDINGHLYFESNLQLTLLYKSTNSIKLGIILFASVKTTVDSDLIGPFNVKISFGSLSRIFSVNNVAKDNCIFDKNTGEITGVIDESQIAWIEINELFSKYQSGTKVINVELLDKKTITDTFDRNIDNQVIELSYTGDIILNNNSVQFSLNGGDSTKYTLEGYNNGEVITSNNLTFNNLVPGVNKLVVRAVHVTTELNIKSEYTCADIIYTDGLTTTAAVINGVSLGIQNNGVATLYRLDVYSPLKELLEVVTYLDEQQPNESNPLPQNVVKHEVIDASRYDSSNRLNNYTYRKYVELRSNKAQQYLCIKINNELYTFYNVDIFQGQINIYSYLFKIMSVESVNSDLVYYSEGNPILNFDQMTGYLNNVFVTDTYATASNPANIISNLESSDGWNESDGRTYFKVTALPNAIFKSPLQPSLGEDFTFELGFKTYNASNEVSPILTFGKFQLRPTQFCWDTTDSSTDVDSLTGLTKEELLFNARNAQFREGQETHLMVTVKRGYTITKSDTYYPQYLDSFLDAFDEASSKSKSINLVRIYINGGIDREIVLNDTELGAFLQATIQINPTACDIDFYLLRVYNTKALDFSQVLQNYISFISEKEDKLLEFSRNDILNDTTNEISFAKSRMLYNTLVYVYPEGARFPNRAWGGGDNEDPPQEKRLENLATTLFVEYADLGKRKYSGRLINGQTKGQGSSAMRYLIWNVTYALNKLKDSSGDKIKSKFTSYSLLDPNTNRFVENATSTEGSYEMPPYEGELNNKSYGVTKLVGKVNFASSMQSHKIGACKLFADAYQNACGTLPSGGKKAVHEEPFLYFYWETDLEDVSNIELQDLIDNDNKIKFMGFQTWGAGKGDDAEYGYDEDLTPEYLLLEGGENTDLSANFLVPWQALLRGTGELGSPTYALGANPTISAKDSLERPWDNLLIKDESIVYDEMGAWDIDYGCKKVELENGVKYYIFDPNVHESLKKFRAFYDFVYTYDVSMISSSDSSPSSSWDNTKKYAIGSDDFYIDGVKVSTHERGDVYRYDVILNKWVPAGTEYDTVTGSWSRLNVIELTKSSSTTLIATALDRIKLIFKGSDTNAEGSIRLFIHLDDVAFHQAFIKLVSGTDNRAKNTYFLIIGPVYQKVTEIPEDGESEEVTRYVKPEDLTNAYQIRLMGDDLDTIFVTDNNGLQSKPYNLLEASYRSSDKKHWGDSGNLFFYAFDLCFEDKIKTLLSTLLKFAFNNSNSIDDNSNYFNRVFFSVQEGFPNIAYNHTAKIYYENAQIIKNSGAMESIYGNNNREPIEQSHGSCLLCEKQFMAKRLNFLSGYALSNMGQTSFITASSAGAGSPTKLRMEFEPYLDFYPNIKYNKDLYLVDNTKESFDILKRLAREGQKYTITFDGGTTPSLNLGLYQIGLYKSLNILGLKHPALSGNLDRTMEFIADNTKLSDYPDLFTPYNSVPYDFWYIDTFSASFPVLERFILKEMDLPEELDLSALHKLRLVDFTGCKNLKKIVLPKSGRLNSLTLPGSINTLEIYNNPNLSNLTFEEIPELETIYIDCSKCNINVSALLESLIIIPKYINLLNCNLNLTEETLRKLLSTNTCILSGNIKIVTEVGSNTTKAINFDTVKSLVNKFGNFKSENSKIKFEYSSARITSISIDSELYLYTDTNKTEVFDNPFNLVIASGNNIEITDSGLGISYEMTISDPSVASINNKTGAVTVNKQSGITATVAISVKTEHMNSPLTLTCTIHFLWKAPEKGYFAYCDGTFSAAYNASKTLAGLVYDIEDKKGLTQDEIMSGIDGGTAYIIGIENINPLYVGYDAGGDLDFTTDYEILLMGYVRHYLTDSGKLGITSNYNIVSEQVSMPDAITKDTSISVSHKGKEDTKAYVNLINNTLLPKLIEEYNNEAERYITSETITGSVVYNISSITNLNNLLELLTTKSTYPLSGCLLYPYFYAMHLYLPAVKTHETLDPQYAKGNWYAPCGSELAVIIKERGLATGEFLNSNDAKTKFITGNTTSIFSKAYSLMGENNPILNIWNNLLAVRNNPTTTVSYGSYANYSYVNLVYDSNNNTKMYFDAAKLNIDPNMPYNYYFTDSDYFYYANYNRAEEVVRFKKFTGIPFTQFIFKKK